MEVNGGKVNEPAFPSSFICKIVLDKTSLILTSVWARRNEERKRDKVKRYDFFILIVPIYFIVVN